MIVDFFKINFLHFAFCRELTFYGVVSVVSDTIEFLRLWLVSSVAFGMSLSRDFRELVELCVFLSL